MLVPATTKNVYAADELPLKVNLPAALIVNTDCSYNEGRHWLAVHINSHEQAEYFDSFGIPPSNPNFILFMQRNSKMWSYNNVTLQSNFSNVCGKYCLMYLYFKTQNYSLLDFVNNFSADRISNDKIVETMYQNVFGDNSKNNEHLGKGLVCPSLLSTLQTSFSNNLASF